MTRRGYAYVLDYRSISSEMDLWPGPVAVEATWQNTGATLQWTTVFINFAQKNKQWQNQLICFPSQASKGL